LLVIALLIALAASFGLQSGKRAQNREIKEE
jgi:hypothetical protein